MKKQLVFLLLLTCSLTLTIAQVPEAFKYQAIVRDADGNPLISHVVAVRISIIQSSINGTCVFAEEHHPTTTALGSINLNIGEGTLLTGSFENIQWASYYHYLKVEIDIDNGSNFTDVGTTQLLSVPYALAAKYSKDNQWAFLDTNVYNINTGNVGIGTMYPKSKLEVKATTNNLNDTLFQVKDYAGNPIFMVFPDGAKVIVPSENKAAAGGFAVSGRSSAKNALQDYLRITPDSTRVYTSDPLKGFGVKNIGATNTTSYLNLTPYNYFIGLEAGKANSSGMNNIFIGKESGYSHKTNDNNIFIGNLAGKADTSGFNNIFVGSEAGANLTNGESNILMGLFAGRSLQNGVHNIFMGFLAGQSTLSSERNVFIGAGAGYNSNSTDNVFIGNWVGFNQKGHSNVILGHYAGFEDTLGFNNIYIGRHAGRQSMNSSGNIFMGLEAGMIHKLGMDNIFIGNYAGYQDSVGNANIFLGANTGRNNKNGANNVFIGYNNGSNFKYGHYNTFLGNSVGVNKTAGNNNVFIGNESGFNNINGNNNVFIGNRAGFYETGSNKLYIANSEINPPLIFGDFSSGFVGLGTITPTNTLEVAGTTKLGINGTTIQQIIKTSVDIDLPAIPNGTAYVQNIIVPNVNMGAVVSISPASILPDGLIISYARVTVANTIECKFFNASNSTIDMDSMSFYLVVIE